MADDARAGVFITVEGGEGSGKTTGIAFIAEYLGARGVDLLQTREPGGTPLAEEIRQLLLEPREEAVAPMAELLLMFAARAQHLQQVIWPALSAGQWVLCDRFTDATYAYQACGRELGARPVEVLETLVQGSFRPDFTLLLDVPVSTGMARARARGDCDRFEAEQLAFFERVRRGYLDRARAEPERYCIIDAAAPLERVQAQMREALAGLLLRRCSVCS